MLHTIVHRESPWTKDLIDRFETPQPAALTTSVSLGGLPWFLDMSYWEDLGITCIFDKYCRKLCFMVEGLQPIADAYSDAHADADACRYPQMNARQTASSMWADANFMTRRHVRHLFKNYYDALCILEVLVPRPLPDFILQLWRKIGRRPVQCNITSWIWWTRFRNDSNMPMPYVVLACSITIEFTSMFLF